MPAKWAPIGAVHLNWSSTVKTFDDLIVMFATFTMRCALMVGTAVAYMQMLTLFIACAMVGTVGLAVTITVVKTFMLPK